MADSRFTSQRALSRLFDYIVSLIIQCLQLKDPYWPKHKGFRLKTPLKEWFLQSLLICKSNFIMLSKSVVLCFKSVLLFNFLWYQYV